MRAAYDEVLASGLKRKHGVQDILGDLLKAEIAEKRDCRGFCVRGGYAVMRARSAL